jgi:hypothetical protein
MAITLHSFTTGDLWVGVLDYQADSDEPMAERYEVVADAEGHWFDLAWFETEGAAFHYAMGWHDCIVRLAELAEQHD